MNSYNFIDLDYRPSALLTDIYKVAHDNPYYLSPSKVYRTDIVGSLRNSIQDTINAEIADCGILRSSPKSAYQYHKDEFRQCAINMLIVEPNSMYITKSMVGITPTVIPYRQDYYMMLNVTELHMAYNKHETQYRYIMSLGFKNTSYKEMLHLYQQGKLLK
jgi:hypothetical protein